MFSRAVGRGGTADKCHWCVWGALAVFQPHWVCPRLWPVCFLHLHCSSSRLLSREPALSCVHFPGLSRSGSSFWVLHKDANLVGPAFCAFPGWSSSGNQELEEPTLPRCSAPSPLGGPSLSFHVRRSGVPCVSSGELVSSCNPTPPPVDVNHLESQEVFG